MTITTLRYTKIYASHNRIIDRWNHDGAQLISLEQICPLGGAG
jgi:hypothetical protein